jgi:hypothetical protein
MVRLRVDDLWKATVRKSAKNSHVNKCVLFDLYPAVSSPPCRSIHKNQIAKPSSSRLSHSRHHHLIQVRKQT